MMNLARNMMNLKGTVSETFSAPLSVIYIPLGIPKGRSSYRFSPY